MGARGPKAGSDAAKRISEALKGRYPKEHYQAIGRAGGRAVADSLGAEHFREAGRKGGKATVEKHGLEHYHEIASRGGSAPRRA